MRPKKENLPNYIRVPVRFSEAEHELIQRVAESERLSMNTWMVRIILAAAREVTAKAPLRRQA